MARWVGCLLLVATLARADDIAGVVVDAAGQPVAGLDVQLKVGLAHYVLTPNYDEWLFVGEAKTAKTDAAGRFKFGELPQGAVGTVFVKTDQAVGVAQGAGELKVPLGAFGGAKGKATGKRQQLKGLRIWVRGSRGLTTAEGRPDKKTGRYEISGLPPGPTRLLIMRNNFVLAYRDVEVVAGKTVAVKTVKVKDKYITGDDPLVSVTKAKVVDGDGKAVPAVQLIWSSRWMDGGMNSDADGVVKLAGGGVAIGGPPYRLRLRSLRGKQDLYHGVLQKVKKGTAIVEVRPLREVSGTVKVGRSVIEQYRLVVVGPQGVARVFAATVKDGKFTAHVPEGDCRFVVGTADGKLREQQVKVAAKNDPITLQLEK